MLQPLQSELLKSVQGVKHAFFTRQGGVSPAPYDSLNFIVKYGDTLANIIENRRRAADWFKVDESHLLMPHLVHGDHVSIIEKPFRYEDRPEADAALSTRPNLVMAVTTADCVPILMVEPQKRLVAAVHAGWRGALKGVIERTIEAIEAQGGSRHTVLAAIGPSIQQPSYEVSKDVFEAFKEANPSFEHFFELNKTQHYQFDLPGLVKYQLEQIQVAEIDWLKIDTYTNPQLFYSCRRSAHEGMKVFGVMLAGIMLQG